MEVNEAIDKVIKNASLDVWVEAALKGFSFYIREIKKKKGGLSKQDVEKYAKEGIQAFRKQQVRKLKIQEDVLRWVIAWVFRNYPLEEQREAFVSIIQKLDDETLEKIKREVINEVQS